MKVIFKTAIGEDGQFSPEGNSLPEITKDIESRLRSDGIELRSREVVYVRDAILNCLSNDEFTIDLQGLRVGRSSDNDLELPNVKQTVERCEE